MSNHIYQFLAVYPCTFIKIFMCVDSEKKSAVIFELHQVSPEIEKAEDIVKGILKHHRSS